ncbi:MAG: ATP-binding protein [Mobilicoccus sp.]|nr:ATP-binding protein [Mobilicoccus sp.]
MTQAPSRPRLSAVLGPEADVARAHALYAALFAAAVLLGRSTVAPETGVALVWPASGVGFVWFLVAFTAAWAGPNDGRRSRVLLAFAGIATTITVLTTGLNIASGMPVDKSLSYAFGNAVSGALAAGCHMALTRVGPCTLTRARQIPVLLAASVAAAVGSALCGPLISVLTGDSASLLWHALARTTIGTLVFGALLLRLLSPAPVVPAPSVRAVSVLALCTLAGYVVTLWWYPHLPITFILTCLTVAAALVLTVDGILAFVAGTGSIIVVTSLADIGPFAVSGAIGEVFIAQSFVGAQVVVGLLLSLGREDLTSLLRAVSRARTDAETQSGLLEVVLSGMSDAVVAIEGDRVIHGNPAAATRFGIHDGEIIPTSALWSGGQGDAPLDRALRGGPVTEDLVYDTGEAAQVFSVRAHPLGAGTDRAVLVARDVTEHRRHVAELASFANVVAHDLLNPIGAAEGWLEVAEDETPPEASPMLLKAVERSRSSVGRARDIVTGLHSYSVARGGELSTSDLDLQALVDDLARGRMAVAVSAVAPEITVDAPVWVRADRALVRQVVDNLLGNAIKYTRPEVTPVITVTGEVVGDAVRVRVDDNGIGIPAGERHRVFEEFHRVPDHRQGAAGTGLGLSICRRMIERHGGHIAAHDSPAGGTRMEFTLPIGQDPSLVADIEEQNRAAATSVAAVRARRRDGVASPRR